MYKLTTSLPGFNLLHENSHKNERTYIIKMGASLGTRKLIVVTLAF